MSRSRYYSNNFATIQGEASSCRDEQQGGGSVQNAFKEAMGAMAPTLIKAGLSALGSGAPRQEGYMPGSREGFGARELKGNRKGGSFGNAPLQKADIPSTSHSRDLRGRGSGGAKRVNCNGGYKYKR